MFMFSDSDILTGVLAIFAGIGVALIFVLKRRKLIAFRKRCFQIAVKAKAEGFDDTARLAEAACEGDIEDIGREIEILERMFETPGAIMAHVDILFAKQLALRLADPTRSAAIFKAVDDARKLLVANAPAAKAAADAAASAIPGA